MKERAEFSQVKQKAKEFFKNRNSDRNSTKKKQLAVPIAALLWPIYLMDS